MCALPFAPHTARVDMRYLWNGEYVFNVFHVAESSLTTPPSISDIADAFLTWWNTDLQPEINADAALQDITVTDLTSASSPRVVRTTGLPANGGAGGDSVSNNVAPLVVHDTGIRRRGSQGRTFLPGLSESGTDGQSLTTPMQSALQTDFDQLPALLAAISPPHMLVVLSYKENGVYREEGLPNPVLSSAVQMQLASQKLRLHGRRRKKRPSTP